MSCPLKYLAPILIQEEFNKTLKLKQENMHSFFPCKFKLKQGWFGIDCVNGKNTRLSFQVREKYIHL
jgi:hypothetical protein